MIHGGIRQYELKFIEEINDIFIGYDLLRYCTKIQLIPSTEYEDCNLSYDMKLDPGRFELSVRIRRNQYLRYKDFTIRTRSQNGQPCEYDKLIEGKGQTYFYAWMSADETELADWIIVDINKIRAYLHEGADRTNPDGTMFKAYTIPWVESHSGIISNRDGILLPWEK